MSNAVQALMYKRKFGDVYRKSIANRLADHADDEGRGIFPAKQTLADEVEISVRAVQKILAEFVEIGLLVVVDPGGRGAESVRRYDMDLAVLAALPLVDVHERRLQNKRADQGANKGAPGAPLEENKGAPGAPLSSGQGAPHDSQGSTGCSQTTIGTLTPLTPHGSSLGEAGRTGSPCDGGEPTNRQETASPFDNAFRQWPGFEIDDREKAWNAWEILDLIERRKASGYIPRFLELWKAKGKRSKPYAFAKYLAERPWERSRASPNAPGSPVFLNPFSVDWMLRRFELCMGGSQADNWKAVRQFDLKTSQGFCSAPPGWTPPAADVEPVPVTSDVYRQWQAAFEHVGWPWLPDVGRLAVVYFPSGGPPAVGLTSEFRAMLSGPSAEAGAREKSDA